jgi:hypothetical protein
MARITSGKVFFPARFFSSPSSLPGWLASWRIFLLLPACNEILVRGGGRLILCAACRFEAFDEPWKVSFNTPGQEWEDKWGLMDPGRKLKPGLKIPDCGGKTVS